VYDELRQLAAQKLAAEKPGQTLQPTALVHEAYLRLAGPGDPRADKDRRHFFAAAAAAMRRILIDSARRKQAQKRGGSQQREPLDAVAAPEPDEELLALDEALEKLAAQDPQKARLVELRYFAGLTGEQAAEARASRRRRPTATGRTRGPGSRPRSGAADARNLSGNPWCFSRWFCASTGR